VAEISRLQPGDVVDRYVVEGLLGVGGMAAVYRVHHQHLGSTHALKVLSAGTRSVRERLMQEGRVQARLRHPNVVLVTDVIDVNGDPGLVLELVDGPALDQLLARERPSVDEALRLFIGITRGVRHAHEQGLIHRDLKPSNVLLARGDEGYLPKVADFGLVKLMAADNADASATKSGAAMGTPEYMAPEQIRDAGGVDHRADLFSLGCILYELLCGVSPFKGGDMLQVFNRITSGTFADPRAYSADLPLNAINVIFGLLETDRNQRISSCDEVLDILQAKSTAAVGELRWDAREAPTAPAEVPPLPPREPSSDVTAWTSLPSIHIGAPTPMAPPPRMVGRRATAPLVMIPVIALVVATAIAVWGNHPRSANRQGAPATSTLMELP